MQVTDIRESGANNILMWAIANGANIKEDTPLISLINDELFYLVTLSDVNFFELFRLTQAYREKLRILQEHQAELPTKEELKRMFPGETPIDPEKMDEKVPLINLAEQGIINFLNITNQMTTDDDIIHPGAVRMFLPMLTRKFDVQIPVNFIDFIESMDSGEAAALFTKEYPHTLKDIIAVDVHGFKTIMNLGFVRATSILRYDSRYDKYLKTIKYAPVIKQPLNGKVYKFNLLGFAKKNNITKSEVRCSLFKGNNDKTASCMKQMAALKAPLMMDFAVMLPIQYMQLLQNAFDRESLIVSYEASMSTIIDAGLSYEDFKLSVYQGNDDINETEALELKEHNNQIEAYRLRLTEANEMLLKIFPLFIENEADVDITNTFAMLPSIYMTTAVITINAEQIQRFTEFGDPVIAEMFQGMEELISSINQSIQQSTK